MTETIFIIAFIVLFLHVTMWEGMIFYPIAQRLKSLPDYIKKPLYDCPICQTPWWGSLILFTGNLSNIWQIHNPIEWIFILFSAAGINTVLIYIVDAGKAITKSLNDMDCNCTKKEDIITIEPAKLSEERKERLKKFMENPTKNRLIKKK